MKLHISIFEMPDGMILATCAEIPMCRVLRQNKGHAITDCKRLIQQFLREREAEGRPFVPEMREIEIS
ncbi:hypothetical protein ACOJUR_01680 [Alicyclobacillus tolerans]|uniref:Uncharacterized protein n=2 Tax=Alicyclobacillus tolerans TaxID=90970 RepID=A0ABT9LYB4_9BACL|nr:MULTISPECIES: hypothetical protein [Alicyclobacillus]MDP9729257.1 hypothetical protein [Alicyclobacillus tengchongensis]QRF22300.1 hypothetical protein FY534_00320 [Alicyclobacillus sp. TC]SHK09701.1 hypothetical protein SAMN05443507_10893 [Alicyclobacillus montanus]